MIEENTTENQPKNERQSANWDLQSAFLNYSTLVISQFAIAFFSFASVWLATRYLGTEGYGGIVAVIAAAQVAQIFVNWTSTALARYGVEEFVESGIINKSFWARTFILIPNIILVIVLSYFWFPVLANWLKLPAETFWSVLAYFIVLTVWIHVQHALQGAKLPRMQGILLAVERVLIFASLCILVFTNRITYLTAVAAYIISPALMIVIGLFQLRHTISFRAEFDAVWLKRILKFSIPLIPFSLIGYFSTNYLDAIFITQYLSKAELGVYSVAYQLNAILIQFPILAGTLIMPLFVTLQTGKNFSKVKVFIQDVLPLLVLIGGILGALSAVAVSILLPLLMGSEFGEAAIIYWILAANFVFVIPSLVGYIPYINSVSATYIATINAIVTAVVNLCGNYFLIPRFGLIGSAWATTISMFMSFALLLLFINSMMSIRQNLIFLMVVPLLAGAIIISISGNYLFSFTVVVGTTFLISIICYKRLLKSFNFLLENKNFFFKN